MIFLLDETNSRIV